LISYLYNFSCKKETINEINLYLEPLNHRDFCINAQKEYPEWIALDEKKRIIFSSQFERKKSKRPASNAKHPPSSALRTPQRLLRTPSFSLKYSFSNSNQNNLPMSSSAKSFATSKKSAARKTIGSRGTHGAFNEGHIVIQPDPPAKYSIDNFINEKSSSLIKKEWNLDTELFKGRTVKNTDSLIEKLKTIFREHYEGKSDVASRKKSIKPKPRRLSSQELRKTGKIDLPRKMSQQITPRKMSLDMRKDSFIGRKITSSSTKLLSSAIDELDTEEQQSVYLKKLKNNFYEQKLWNSLELTNRGNQINFYPETEREYTSEFSILQRYDWTQSTFGKSKFN
jgi:hypothetical protein